MFYGGRAVVSRISIAFPSAVDHQIAAVQIPFLLNISDAVLAYIDPFDFSPKSTFRLFEKLDLMWASLLQGTDAETGEVLPGLATGRKMTETERVRLRAIVDRARLQVLKKSGESALEMELTNSASDTEDESRYSDVVNDQDIDAARIYERTLVVLGDSFHETILSGGRITTGTN